MCAYNWESKQTFVSRGFLTELHNPYRWSACQGPVVQGGRAPDLVEGASAFYSADAVGLLGLRMCLDMQEHRLQLCTLQTLD